MGWIKEALGELTAGRNAQVRPKGGSMRGRIESGQLVTLAPVPPENIGLNDVVLVRWRGHYLLHLVKDIKDENFLIGNNVGKINGWVPRSDIIARVIVVHPLLSEEDS